MLYARALFFSGASRRWRLRAATGAPEVSFVHCYRLAWSRYVDVEGAVRGCRLRRADVVVGAGSRAQRSGTLCPDFEGRPHRGPKSHSMQT